MYSPRLMKRLGLATESGAVRASLVHYNTVEEVRRFGSALAEMRVNDSTLEQKNFMLTDKQIQEIRSRFSIFQRKIYLNTCSQGALSDAVQTGLEDYIASWHEQGSPWETWVERYEDGANCFCAIHQRQPG